jgi:hypothetical protein
VRRACRARKIEDSIHLGVVGEGHVVSDNLEVRVTDEMSDVSFLACKEIVQTDDVKAVSQQPLAQMASQKPGTTSYQCACFQ